MRSVAFLFLCIYMYRLNKNTQGANKVRPNRKHQLAKIINHACDLKV